MHMAWILLEKDIFGAKVRLVNPDGNEHIEVQGYNTDSKVTTKDLRKELEKHLGKS